MQERYLGDIHDYVKYALLRELHQSGFGPIGLCWFLTHHKQVDATANNDGEKRHHLTSRDWQHLDPELLDMLAQFEDVKSRRIAKLERSSILPDDTIFSAYDPPTQPTKRMGWWSESLRECQNSETIFADPDNGFIVPSASGKRRSKYAEYEEIRGIYRSGKTAISIQFGTRKGTIEEQARRVRRKLTQELPECRHLPVLRGRTSPNILFLFLAPPVRQKTLSLALERFVNRAPRMLELVN